MKKIARYKIIRDLLKDRISSGTWGEAFKVPSEKELCEEFGVSRMTLRQTMEDLQRLGLISKEPGRGTFVNSNARRLKLDNKESGTNTPSAKKCVLVSRGLFDDNPYYQEIVDGINQGFAESNIRVKRFRLESEENLEQILKNEHGNVPDGFIFIQNDQNDTMSSDIATASSYGAPIVCLCENTMTSYVDIDSFHGGLIATRCLLSCGNRRVVFALGPRSIPQNERKLAGYRQALNEAGIAFDQNLILELEPWSEKSGADAASKLLELNTDFDSAIVHGDHACFAFCNFLTAKGIKIPDDKGIIVYDDFAWLQKAFSPRLTAIKQPFREMSVEAAKMIIEKIILGENERTIRILRPSLEIRESCGVVRKMAMKLVNQRETKRTEQTKIHSDHDKVAIN